MIDFGYILGKVNMIAIRGRDLSLFMFSDTGKINVLWNSMHT